MGKKVGSSFYAKAVNVIFRFEKMDGGSHEGKKRDREMKLFCLFFTPFSLSVPLGAIERNYIPFSFSSFSGFLATFARICRLKKKPHFLNPCCTFPSLLLLPPASFLTYQYPLIPLGLFAANFWEFCTQCKKTYDSSLARVL